MCAHSVMSDSLRPYGGACQAPLSMGFFRQEYWSGLPFSPPGNLPNPGIKSAFPAFPELQVNFFIKPPMGQKKVYIPDTGNT